jgi:carbon monoxide dehydrogenase subunit G
VIVEVKGERYVEARSEQVWMVVDDVSCRGRWLEFHDRVTEVIVIEPARSLTWNTQDHARIARPDCRSCVTIELIPEGAGTRVRLLAHREPSSRLAGLAGRRAAQRAYERDISRSLDRLAQMLVGGRSA